MIYKKPIHYNMNCQIAIAVLLTALIATGFIVKSKGITKESMPIITYSEMHSRIMNNIMMSSATIEESEAIPEYNIPLSKELQEYTYNLSNQYNISYELVLALMWQESNMNNNSIHKNKNGTKDRGLMQINSRYMNSWAKSYNISNFNPFNSKQNILMGIRILNDRITYWSSKGYCDDILIYSVLGSYNRGVSGFNRYKKRYGYKTVYAKNILKYKEQLETKNTFLDYLK